MALCKCLVKIDEFNVNYCHMWKSGCHILISSSNLKDTVKTDKTIWTLTINWNFTAINNIDKSLWYYFFCVFPRG